DRLQQAVIARRAHGDDRVRALERRRERGVRKDAVADVHTRSAIGERLGHLAVGASGGRVAAAPGDHERLEEHVADWPLEPRALAARRALPLAPRPARAHDGDGLTGGEPERRAVEVEPNRAVAEPGRAIDTDRRGPARR